MTSSPEMMDHVIRALMRQYGLYFGKYRGEVT